MRWRFLREELSHLKYLRNAANELGCAFPRRQTTCWVKQTTATHLGGMMSRLEAICLNRQKAQKATRASDVSIFAWWIGDLLVTKSCFDAAGGEANEIEWLLSLIISTPFAFYFHLPTHFAPQRDKQARTHYSSIHSPNATINGQQNVNRQFCRPIQTKSDGRDDFFAAFHAFLRLLLPVPSPSRFRFFLRVGLLIIIAAFVANSISEKEPINSSIAIIYKVDERREIWQNLLPPHCLLIGRVDSRFLSKHLKVSSRLRLDHKVIN